MEVLGFAGSLRRGSFNKGLLRAAVEMAPEGMSLSTFDLEGMPLYNQDLDQQPPPRISQFKAAIRAADALLIVTPEYNYSISGVLKNALDCASRPHGDNAFDGKPVALMGASIGMIATARAQYHLRQSFVFLNMYAINKPEVMVPFADAKFDKEGRLTDEATRQKVRDLLESLALWATRFR